MQKATFTYVNLSFFTWVKVVLCIAVLTGVSSAIFLHLLQIVTQFREENNWIILFLPIAGISIVYLYKKYGQTAKKGNNLLLEEYYNPQGKISWIMSPLIIVSTLLTHLFGGSAGREGTAVQYGGTYADQVAKNFNLGKGQYRIALLAGVASGFASLFGTPLAGILFSLELFKSGKIRIKSIPIVIITAYLSYFFCNFLQAPHTTYPSVEINYYFDANYLFIIPIAILCGLTARLFILSGNLFSNLFRKVSNEYYRIVIGAIIILLLVYLFNTNKYIGLGLPSIASAFETPANSTDFILKIVFTTLTLSVGFKGGEVTPLFFIGATLASFLSLYIPLPLVLLAAIGFISVFAGATKTPIACAVMAVELFGFAIFPFVIISCFISTWSSGNEGIYKSQRNLKNWF